MFDKEKKKIAELESDVRNLRSQISDLERKMRADWSFFLNDYTLYHGPYYLRTDDFSYFKKSLNHTIGKQIQKFADAAEIQLTYVQEQYVEPRWIKAQKETNAKNSG